MSNSQDYFMDEDINLRSSRAQSDSNSGHSIDCDKFDLGNSASSQENKICLVCGDKAIGNNFGVTTCDSCKAFFRRYVLKGLDARCPFDGHCIINRSSRKDCPMCRLQKCLQVGMTSDYAGTRRRREKNPNCGQSRQRTMVKVEPEKDMEDKKEDESAGTSNFSSSSWPPPPPSPSNPEQLPEIIQTIIPHVEKALEGSDVLVTVRVSKSALHRNIERSGGGQGDWLDMAGLLFGCNDNQTALTSGREGDLVKEWISVQIVPSETQPTNADENRTLFVKEDYPVPLGSPTTETSQREMVPMPVWSETTQHDISMPQDSALFGLRYLKLEELQLANQEWDRPASSVRPLIGSTPEDFTKEDYFNMVHFSLQCVLKQHTRLSAFKEFDWEDQMALVKATFHELKAIRTIGKYDAGAGLVRGAYPGKPGLVFKIGTRIKGNIFQTLCKMISSTPEKWRCNDSLMLIVSAVAFFNSAKTTLKNKAAVDAQRTVYLHLLKDYLECTFDREEAKMAYDYLPGMVGYLSEWSKTLNGLMFDANPRTYDLLLVDFNNFD